MGYPTMIPMNDANENRPSPEGLNRYGGGERNCGARVEIITTLHRS